MKTIIESRVQRGNVSGVARAACESARQWLSLAQNIVRFILSGLLAALLCANANAQFNYEMYDASFDVLPDFSQLTPDETGTSSVISDTVTSQTETFALVFTNTLTVTTGGIYEFFTNSDDGSKLYIDGAVVVDNDGLHGARTVAGNISLNPGTYSLRVEFFEKNGGNILEVGYRTENPSYEPIPANGALVYNGSDKSVFGEWGAVIPWPEIAISAANLPDGRVLTWSSTETWGFPSGPNFTHASVFNPVDETFVTVDSNFHDMFCAGISTLESGVIVASGGNPQDRRTSSFDPDTLSWTALSDMNDLRWYGANVTLPNNKIFSTFAKSAGNRSELYDPSNNTWTATPHSTMQTLLSEQNAINSANNPSGSLNFEWWAHIAVAPQGDVFQGGPTPTWHRFDPEGGAANVSLGQPIGDVGRMYGNAVTYDAGKVMLVGGADRRNASPTSVNNAYLVDLNGATPVVTSAAPMTYPRALSNTVVLPNGGVMVIGGNTVAKIFNDQGSVLPAEIYTPSTDSWQVVDSLTIPRNYHSTALLLKDGRVLSAGGGACGQTCAANHLDGQIFTPPYLFNSDGSAATRPTLSNVAAQVGAGSQIVVTASSDTQSFSMVRLSGTTHHLNTDQRFLPVASADNGDGTFTLTFNANPNILIVGNYWLFAVNANGTPSVGETVQVVNNLTVPPPPPVDPASVFISDLAWSAETNGWGPAERDLSNGEQASGDGGTITLNGASYAKGVGTHATGEITVDLAGGYDRFRSDIGLDDSRNGLCGSVQFQVDVDGINQFSSGTFTDTTPTATIDLDVSGANTLTLKVLNGGDGDCGDHADWANARLIPPAPPGFRYYRFTPTKLRNDGAANSVQLAEFSLFLQGTRLTGATATNPGGNNPAGETPPMADDSNLTTKWLDFNKGALVYDYGQNVLIDSYTITTANDASSRDPVRWTLEGSVDANTWVILDDQTAADFATPTARFTEIAPLPATIPGQVTALPEQPRVSSTLIVESSSGQDRIWNVNPDNDSVSISDAGGSLLLEIPVGDNPWSLAKQPGASRVFVTNKDDATLTIIDTVSLTVDQTVNLPTASQPHGIVFESDGSHYFVVLEATGSVEKRSSSTHAVAASLAVGGTPRHASMAFDDSRLFVSNFITPPLAGESTSTINLASGAAEIFSILPSTMALSNTVNLTHDDRGLSESQGPGMPNYLGAAVVSYDNQFAYVPSKKDNVQSGVLRGVAGMTFESTVRANTSRFDLATESEDAGFRIDLDNSSVATHAAISGDNRYVLIVLETSRELSIYDAVNGFELMRVPTGIAPQSVALSSDGATAYVHNFMDRSISRFDLSTALGLHIPSAATLTSIDVVTTEQLAANVFAGKQLFYDAADDRLARDNYMSCASCHKEGKHDGRVWDLSGMGEGLRETISLVGKGAGHGRLHYTGNFDEVQDFEGQIRTLAGGTGLMLQADFDSTSDPLGAAKAGLSVDLDNLAAYVESLTVLPDSPHKTGGSLSSSALAGKSLFFNLGCVACHSPSALTDSSLNALHDIGTIDSDSGQRLSAALTGFDTPTVIGAWSHLPLLHDGSAMTIEAAVNAHTSQAPLNASEMTAMVSFLMEVEAVDTADMIDSDGDGVADFEDAAPANACIPSAFNANCLQDTDGDGDSDFTETEIADGDADGTPDYQESSLTDADADGLNDEVDPENNDACMPSAFNANCAQDTDSDGSTDFAETETADTDGDGTPDYQESSILDADGDGVNDQVDAANIDACLPSAFNANCAQDTDGDGSTDFAETETADSDGDGAPDYQESSLVDTDSDGLSDQADSANANACLPSAFNSSCVQDTDSDGASDFAETETADSDGDGAPDYQESSLVDTDSDGLSDQADSANADACAPSAFNASCAQDTDGDGSTDFAETETADSDGDGNPDYLESSIVDADGDGVSDQTDAANSDACLPSAFNVNCAQDSDGDGATDFVETETADTDGDGAPDYQESSLVDTDSDGVNNQVDAADSDACLPSAFNASCVQDTDGDGSTDFAETETADTDGDGTPDYQESSIFDADSDGVSDQADAANSDACLPSAFNASCAQDTDGDGSTDFAETETADSDGDGTPDYQESSLVDTDGDGLSDQADSTNADACQPSAFNANCAQDSDGDGASDFVETETADSDGDGAPDYQESSLVDADNDGLSDQTDSSNANACLPSTFNSNCAQDTDGDGASDFVETETADSDGDGKPDYQESSLADADADGVDDQSDADDANSCLPSAFNANCSQDTDGDGASDFAETETVDSDGDGAPDYLESSILDADTDGVSDQDDPVNADACLPSAFNVNCAQDSDGDGATDFVETETADADGDGAPDYQESAILDADSDGVNDQADAADGDACVPSAFNASCTQDTDGDGSSDFVEGEFTDTDGDGLYDFEESSILDQDSDATMDQEDPANLDACVPDASACQLDVPTLTPAHIIVMALALGIAAMRARKPRNHQVET